MAQMFEGDPLIAFQQGMVTALGHPVAQNGGPFLRAPFSHALQVAYPDAFAALAEAERLTLPVGSIMPVEIVDGRYIVHLIVQETWDAQSHLPTFDVKGFRTAFQHYAAFLHEYGLTGGVPSPILPLLEAAERTAVEHVIAEVDAPITAFKMPRPDLTFDDIADAAPPGIPLLSRPARPLVTLVTDGSCLGNPGPGGWAALLRFGPREKVLTGSAPDTTNNRMELTALLAGLQALKQPCGVSWRSDSQYLVQAFTQGWLTRWMHNGFIGAQGRPVQNRDLWEQIAEAARPHFLTPQWVKGHSTDLDNLRVDALARQAAEEQISAPKSPAPHV